MNYRKRMIKRILFHPVSPLFLMLLLLPTGVSAQKAGNSTSSAVKQPARSYRQDNLSDFLAERLEKEYQDSSKGDLADVAHLNRTQGGISILQKQFTFSQTLDTFLSIDKEKVGTPFFCGRYAQKSGNGYLGSPTNLWLTQAPDGSLAVVSWIAARNYAVMSVGNPQNQLTSYRVAAAATDGLPAYQIQYDLGYNSGQRITMTRSGNSKTTRLSYPANAVCYNSLNVANITLRGLGLKEAGEVREVSAFDLEPYFQGGGSRSVRFEHKGKEVVTVEAGKFNANHIEASLIGGNRTSPSKSPEEAIHFWVLDNGILVRILRTSDNADTSLAEYVATGQLAGTVEDSFTKAVALAPNTLVTVDVPAFSRQNAPWISTGYTVKAGDKIAFRSTGVAKYDPADAYPPVDADGLPVVDDKIPFIGGPNSPVGALIGRIASFEKPSEIFTIGKESVYEAKQAGVLFLGINDQYGKSTNNSGVLKTEFIIGSLPPATPESQQAEKMEEPGPASPATVQRTGKMENPYGVFTPFKGKDVAGPVQPVGTILTMDMDLICSTASSTDGRFIYSACCNGSMIGSLSRNAVTGELQIVQTVQDFRYLNGAVSVRVSPDNRYLASVSCNSNSVILFSRNPESGILTALDMVLNSDLKDRPLTCVTHCAFSPDSKFLYVIASGSAAVTGFRITDSGKLEWVDTNLGEAQCLGDARGIAMSPDGNSIYVAAAQGDSLVVLNRDVVSGKMDIRQILRDEEAGITALAGAFGVSCSSDGKYVYVSSGRFGGDSAVLVFKVGEDKKLSIVQEILGGPNGSLNYLGGNDIVVSRDGKRVAASGSDSNTVVCFTVDSSKGMLNPVQTLTRDEKDPEFLHTPNQMTFSPDGKYLYVTLERKAVTVYRWDD